MAEALDALLEPWRQGVMARALAEVALIGLVGGALGCWIVLYELSYGAESLSHAMFPGLVVAALAGAPLLVGAAGGLAIAALGVAAAGRAPEVGRETAIAVVVSALFGLGALLALSADAPPGLQELLFGDVLAVADSDLALAAALAAVVVVGLAILHRQLLAVGFDRSCARGLGARPLLADVGLLALVAVAILVAVRGLGSLLVVAALVGPAAAAGLAGWRIVPTMALAVGLALAAGVAGLYVSYYADTAAGASIAAAIVLLHASSLAVARVKSAAA